MKTIFFEIVEFIKNPTDQRIDHYSLAKNLQYLFIVLLIDILINLVFYEPLILLLDKVEPMVMEPRIIYSQNTFWVKLFLYSVFAPLSEEIIFRLWLKYRKFYHFFISRNKWDRIFKHLVYFSTISFGLIHISNYENNSTLFYILAPLIVSTQIFGGFLIAFIRIRFNFISGILLHSLWNFFALIIVCVPFFKNDDFIKNEKEYKLSIQEISFNHDGNQTFEIDSSKQKIHSLHISEYSYNHILDSLFNFNRPKNDILIDLNFESKNGIKKNTLKKLLLEYDKFID
ncbi:CPBP family intramembrane metalloprotease [Ornithobacterium rhinotracheale]|uniref:CPBP family intramembrane glutamic endopeptidase n=1 Tax=Ornithobacterium rhinotracheale TaxID=28251 RepID=UPI00129D1D6B|nr:CPBP family intramembrane glutamic endopeptidase [Ornithobacterium rhinotracheale]MRI63118.1 CPBP family intramembrane metalloprotease [Ornithobacterium rhinotracheale]